MTGWCWLEPEKWVGKRFPLLRYLKIDADLSQGEWTIMFHRHDCSECRRAVPKYVRACPAV